MNEVIEIERKWVLDGLPEGIVPIKSHEIEQAYLDVRGLRLRKKDEGYLITYKSKGDLARSEWEQEIPAWTYDGLKAEARAVLHKTRHVYNGGEVALELDEYHGELEGLYTIEAEWALEIPSTLTLKARQELIQDAEKAAKSYILPYQFSNAHEVTGLKAYSNRSLAVHGLPKPN